MIRVLVTISEAQPELLYELQHVKVRHRAERLRSLAFAGLHRDRTVNDKPPSAKTMKVKPNINHDIHDAMNASLKSMEYLGK